MKVEVELELLWFRKVLPRLTINSSWFAYSWKVISPSLDIHQSTPHRSGRLPKIIPKTQSWMLIEVLVKEKPSVTTEAGWVLCLVSVAWCLIAPQRKQLLSNKQHCVPARGLPKSTLTLHNATRKMFCPVPLEHSTGSAASRRTGLLEVVAAWGGSSCS